jgi:hypothetical protein
MTRTEIRQTSTHAVGKNKGADKQNSTGKISYECVETAANKVETCEGESKAVQRTTRLNKDLLGELFPTFREFCDVNIFRQAMHFYST